MATRFIVSERVNNEWKKVTSWSDRADALRAVATSLMNDETTNPQNFKIEEVDEADIKAILMKAAETIAEDLKIFGCTFKVTDCCANDGGFIDMILLNEYPSLTDVELRRIISVIDGYNKGLQDGHEVIFNITHKCAIRLLLTK